MVPLTAMSRRCCSVRWLLGTFHALCEVFEFLIQFERRGAGGREIDLERNLAAFDDEVDDAARVEKPAVLADQQHVLALDFRGHRLTLRARRRHDHVTRVVDRRRRVELLRLQLASVDVLARRELVEHVRQIWCTHESDDQRCRWTCERGGWPGGESCEIENELALECILRLGAGWRDRQHHQQTYGQQRRDHSPASGRPGRHTGTHCASSSAYMTHVLRTQLSNGRAPRRAERRNDCNSARQKAFGGEREACNCLTAASCRPAPGISVQMLDEGRATS